MNETFQAAVAAAEAELGKDAPTEDVVRAVILALKNPCDEVIDAGGSAQLQSEEREREMLDQCRRESGGIPAFISSVPGDTFNGMLDAVLRNEQELEEFRIARGY